MRAATRSAPVTRGQPSPSMSDSGLIIKRGWSLGTDIWPFAEGGIDILIEPGSHTLAPMGRRTSTLLLPGQDAKFQAANFPLSRRSILTRREANTDG